MHYTRCSVHENATRFKNHFSAPRPAVQAARRQLAAALGDPTAELRRRLAPMQYVLWVAFGRSSQEGSRRALFRMELRMMNIDTPPIKPVTLRHRIVEVIRQAITSGDLGPGDRIVELQLAKQLGVGNTAVREALFELERATT